ncbi:hypothetical protein BDEG_20396 [Batrachochytrium dendrobatidis JEL423]|uniref:alpha-1,2-Mannosidase n=1 Tax=Batrachochytrium dendrobatidis (strain JEL423) TaxID=403673 RepID=A0A177W9Y7_BATDL|nr:hypothetical protein BDEG_20396 [Batrachochytrium dendrobatidis JEL423]
MFCTPKLSRRARVLMLSVAILYAMYTLFTYSTFTLLPTAEILSKMEGSQYHETPKSPPQRTNQKKLVDNTSEISSYSPDLNGNPVAGEADPEKQEFIRNMIRHAWSGYMKYAQGSDELKPLSKSNMNWTYLSSTLFTPLDSMSTLYIVGLSQEFNEAKSLVINQLNYDVIKTDINVFETVIRALGGLISAYDLEQDKRLLDIAVDLADRLESSFRTPTGIPNNMALRALEQITSIKTSIEGLAPKTLNSQFLREISRDYSVSAETDSYYEYLNKLWISTGDIRYRKLYDAAASAIEKYILVRTPNGRAYIPERHNDVLGLEFHHLSCFAGGMFASGAVTLKNEHSDRYIEIAAELTRTCYDSYQIRATKLGGEWTRVSQEGDLYASGHAYHLRPEAVESIFYMWRYTHDPKYREWGWNIVQALETSCKDDVGYHGLNNSGKPFDRQESFFIAETLKYLFLLFSDDQTVDLNEYVFNTEAHPISIRGHGRRKDRKKWVEIPQPGKFPKNWNL